MQIRLMLQQKKDVENKIANIMTAIENGIFTETTKRPPRKPRRGKT